MERHSNSGDENDDIELVGDPADFDEMGNPIGVTSEYDEHGDPTPESLQRWEARRAARAQKLLDEVRETIAEVRRERAEKIAAGIDPGPHLITVDVLRAAGALDVPPAWRKSLGGGAHRQLDLFDDDAPDNDQASGDDDSE